jgi:hypothetical protein
MNCLLLKSCWALVRCVEKIHPSDFHALHDFSCMIILKDVPPDPKKKEKREKKIPKKMFLY